MLCSDWSGKRGGADAPQRPKKNTERAVFLPYEFVRKETTAGEPSVLKIAALLTRVQ